MIPTCRERILGRALRAVPPSKLIEVGCEFCEGEMECPEREKLAHHPDSGVALPEPLGIAPLAATAGLLALAAHRRVPTPGGGKSRHQKRQAQ